MSTHERQTDETPTEASTPPVAPDSEEVEVLCEQVEEEQQAARSALWMRLCAAGLYLAIATACVAGGATFFIGPFSTSTDWVFGAMAFALAGIALLGIKESLFPSDWRPED